MIKNRHFKYHIFFVFLFITMSCGDSDDVIETPDPPANFTLENLAAPAHYPGIAVFTADMSKSRFTELNGEWTVRKSTTINTSTSIQRNGYNSVLKINFDGFKAATDYVEFVVAVFGRLTNRMAVPDEFLKGVNGISFRAVSYDVPVKLEVEALDIVGKIISTQEFIVSQSEMSTFNFKFDVQKLHHLVFKINGSDQDLNEFTNGAISIDDIYLANNSTIPFTPPNDNTQFLQWLKECSLRYFLWQYRSVNGDKGVVLENYSDLHKVSLSGIGYAYAAFILASQEGMITPEEAKQKIRSILRWQQAQDWFNGTEGKFGFPLHYYHSNGTGLWADSDAAVSTIDWAMCAAGIRVVRQNYATDAEIVALCNELLDRPQWQEVINKNVNNNHGFGRIIKGINATTGKPNDQVWADAFSEEAEIIYLEALASGKVDNLDLDRIYRAKKNGFYISWFGSGFTYNWLQLWTGTKEPYLSNSVAAYQYDGSTCQSAFGKPLMGLTACSTLSGMDATGFIRWDRYIGNQGSSVSGAKTSEVIQTSPAPYGAALALPFQYDAAISALREYVKIGYYHPLLGLPDNVRLNNFPSGLNSAVPHWDPFDINIGPIAMAIEQTQNNTLGKLYLQDEKIEKSLVLLVGSF
jgi:hypothetical protein